MASSTIKETVMPRGVAVTPNDTYVQLNGLSCVRIGNIVVLSGRLEMKANKPSGQADYLISGYPTPAGSLPVYVPNSAGYNLLISASGTLTSNEALAKTNFQLECSYICS